MHNGEQMCHFINMPVEVENLLCIYDMKAAKWIVRFETFNVEME